MILINFAHPLTTEHLKQIEGLTNQRVVRVIEIPTHIDPQERISLQVAELIEQVGLSPTEWQASPLLINPPSLNFIAITLLVELHGRCGYFPAHLRMRPVKGSVPLRYEAAEVLNLQDVRESARKTRSSDDRHVLSG